MIMLIKPQFEAGRTALKKKGIVRDKKDHLRVLQELSDFFYDCGLAVLGIRRRRLRAVNGNIRISGIFKENRYAHKQRRKD